MVASTVVRPLDLEDRVAADERRKRLLAALEQARLGQSELHRKMLAAGERRIALGTINKWCTGKAPMTEMTLRGVLTLLGLPPDWKPGKLSPPS